MTRVPSFSVDAVAFDLDGTLLDTVHDLAAAVNLLLAELGHPPLHTVTVRDLVGKGMASLVRKAMLRARGRAPDDAELAALLPRYQAHYESVLGRETEAFPGLLETLVRLQDEGFRMAVVTNKATRFVAANLDHAGLGGAFDAVVGGEPHALGPGTWFRMPARVPHSIVARTPLRLALYLLPAGE